VNALLAGALLFAVFLGAADAIWASQWTKSWHGMAKAAATVMLAMACGVLWIVTEPSRLDPVLQPVIAVECARNIYPITLRRPELRLIDFADADRLGFGALSGFHRLPVLEEGGVA
jgi:hypothetical protein